MQKHMEIMALHRYYVHTTLMKQRFEEELAKGEYIVDGHEDPIKNFILTGLNLGVMPVGTYMEYWYGGLYVVCEGWKDIGLSDPAVDALLADPKIEALRRFRNAAFHFQRDYLSQKKNDFVSTDGSVPYIREVSKELDRWFLEYIRGRGGVAESTTNG
jgi:hypothetical protein